MAIIKCKMCGGDLILTEGSSVAECEFCGTLQTVPSADNEKKLTLFARANRLRAACEFDKAAGIYESIVADFPEEAEAYWGLVLCRYGIEYVDDPATGRKIPTCHRSSFESVLEDSDLDQALENADTVARKVYRDEARQIEELRKGIIEVSGREEPYDIFICYKETAEGGGRTLDSVLAQDIYDALTGKGYRVFFSRISLEDKLGREYEPYIFAALNSAKIMLAVGTDYEHFNAIWVKNEWSRYLKLMAQDKEKHLIPCYKDIDAYDMPKEFAKLQAQDLGKIGATQDLLRGIEKLLPRQQKQVPQPVLTVDKPAQDHSNAISLGFLDIQSGQEESARNTFRQILTQDQTCAEAYLGLLLICKDQERDAYTAKFRQYAGKTMSEIEKSLLCTGCQERLLKLYCKLHDFDRVRQGLELIGELTATMVNRLVRANPSVELIDLLGKHGAQLALINTSGEKGKDQIVASLLSNLILDKVDVSIIEAMLRNGADLRRVRTVENQYGLNRYSPLFDSIHNVPNPKIAKLLLEAGANQNFVAEVFHDNGEKSFRVPMLNAAIENNMPEIAKMLLERGVDPNGRKQMTTKNGVSQFPAIYECVVRNSPQIMKMLLQAGADANDCSDEVGENGTRILRPVLHLAAQDGYVELVRLLLEAGADPNRQYIGKKTDGTCIHASTPLIQSICTSNQLQITQLLLQHGADPNTVFVGIREDGTRDELPALYFAARDNRPEHLQLLLQKGADPNKEGIVSNPKWGNAYLKPLASAISTQKSVPLTRLLLEAGANASGVAVAVNPSTAARTPKCMLYLAACEAKSAPLVNLLLKHGATLNDPVDYLGKTIPIREHPLYDAPEDVKKVIQRVKLGEEKQKLQSEYATLSGIFTAKRRKEIEARLAQIESELRKLT